MFAIRIEFLTGRYCAQAHTDREMPEWPPHPARLFSALVAAWAADGQAPEERAALEWLERLPAPLIHASAAAAQGIDPPRRAEHTERSLVLTTFVPVNDPFVISPAGLPRAYERIQAARAALSATDIPGEVARAQKRYESAARTARTWSGNAERPSGKGSVGVLPGDRIKQPRTFPSVVPDDPVVHFQWLDEDPSEHWGPLQRVAARVPRLGHSSSIVEVRIVDDAPEANLEPADDGIEIRLPGSGQVEALVQAHRVHGGVAPRVLPFRSQSYRERQDRTSVARSSMSGEWLVLEVGAGAYLRLADTMPLTHAIRAALMSHARDPIPPVLSGHQPDGSPAREPHLAILPLPFVGHGHADGGVRGFALMLPVAASLADRVAVTAAVHGWAASGGGRLALRLPGGREIWLTRLAGEPAMHTLRRGRWAQASRLWTTVTPVAFDRAPGRLSSASSAIRVAAERAAADVVAASCERVGLPRPLRVTVTRSGGLAGVPNLGAFPVYQSPGRGVRRVSSHIELMFADPVRGPVVLGAGRFFGMGLFAPVRAGDDDAVG